MTPRSPGIVFFPRRPDFSDWLDGIPGVLRSEAFDLEGAGRLAMRLDNLSAPTDEPIETYLELSHDKIVWQMLGGTTTWPGDRVDTYHEIAGWRFVRAVVDYGPGGRLPLMFGLLTTGAESWTDPVECVR